MNKNQKQEIVAEVASLLDGVSGLYSIDFTGLNVADTIRLRREFKKAGITYKVAKNTLVKIAMQNAGGFDTVLEKMTGQTGIALGYDDPVGPARVLDQFIDPKLGIPKLNFAIIEGEVFDGSKLKDLAKMPSRMDLLGSVVGALNAPASGLVGVINAVMRDLSSVIEEVAKKREGVSA
jgi:large subunit ribosomal protein L10